MERAYANGKEDSEASLTQRVVLASGSPRRRELIRALDIPAQPISPNDGEGPQFTGETPADFVIRLALGKAHQVAAEVGEAIVLSADTVVVLDGDVLGKPANDAEATRMLRRLRGRVHTVLTGVTALDVGSGRWVSVTKSTDVTLRHYSDDELGAYVASGEPLDKAGAYAVQDERFNPAERIQGCYSNAVGLPLCEVVTLLDRLGIQARPRRGWRAPQQCHDCPLAQEQEAPVR